MAMPTEAADVLTDRELVLAARTYRETGRLPGGIDARALTGDLLRLLAARTYRLGIVEAECERLLGRVPAGAGG